MRSELGHSDVSENGHYDRRRDDQTHFFSGELNAQLPLGIFLALEVQARSGDGYTITTGRDDNGDTESNDRPPGVPRNGGREPRSLTTDLNFSKMFFLRSNAGGGSRTGGAGTQLNVFANITNVLNRANLKNVSGALTSSRFSQATRADDPREIEVGMRFQF